MEKTYSQLVSVMEILKEAIKLLGRNSKIFLIIAVFTMIPNTLLTLAHLYSLALLADDLSMSALSSSSVDPTSTEFHKQLYKFQADLIFIKSELIIYLVLMTVILLSSTVSTVYVSAMSYLGKDLTIKVLWSKLKKIWVRPLITWFYICLMITGIFFMLTLLLPVVIFWKGSVIVVALGSILFLLVTSVNMYLVLLWMLSLVISVLEDCSGLEALAKSENLVKGRKVVGFALTFVMSMLFSLVYVVSFVSKHFGIFKMPLMLNLVTLVKILSVMVYTVFYFERKQSLGESLELEKKLGYNSVSATPLDSTLP